MASCSRDLIIMWVTQLVTNEWRW